MRTWIVCSVLGMCNISQKRTFCHDDDENVYFPDSVYIDRLSRLPSVIALPYNNIVRDCIDLYAERKTKFSALYAGDGGLLFSDNRAGVG